MIPIYLCDDQINFLNEITQIVEKITLINNFNFNIKLVTQNPDELLINLETYPKQGIYFLDVDLGDTVINGFELGSKIRTLDPRGFIIYVTTHDELLYETFKYRLEALDYIIKDNVEKMWESINSCLSDVNKRLTLDSRDLRQYFAVEKGANTTYVPMEDIIYIKTTPKKHVIALITKDEIIEFYGNLSNIEKKLDKSFLRVHRSFIINTNYIKSCDYRKKILYLNHNKTCDIARNKIKQVKSELERRI